MKCKQCEWLPTKHHDPCPCEIVKTIYVFDEEVELIKRANRQRVKTRNQS